MTLYPYIIVYTLFLPVLAFSQIANPVNDFKTGLKIPPDDRILKWECDVNGDGKKEVLLVLKSVFFGDMQNHEPPGWSFYIANASGSDYTRSTGTVRKHKTLSVDDLPLIDPEACFVGQITELGKRGIVTMRIDNPRDRESVGIIYAYTIEGDHLKRTELARYTIVEGPHALFTKCLKDGKRTVVTPVKLDP